ncbi:hypothetical protein HYC85_029644 [Camellia sinensis]|uniref:Uncharacterized protein n=1 Tax=Camellia sinensis TaxID=4442 RepID=A0A7J7FYG9_CAMSI|nr:hypothetical protein HYC85_029644 [Camellia sinensis]
MMPTSFRSVSICRSKSPIDEKTIPIIYHHHRIMVYASISTQSTIKPQMGGSIFKFK